jgi:hypothetical protein
MQTTTTTPSKKVILIKGGALKSRIIKPKPAAPAKTKTFSNPRFKNSAGKSFYLFPINGSHECP